MTQRNGRVLPWAFVLAAAVAGAALMLTSATPGSAQVGPPPNEFRSITLSGAEEVPPVTTDAVGTFLWRVTSAGIDAELVLDGTQFTMAHFHLGAKGANGPVVAFLFQPIMEGQKAIHSFVTLTAKDLVGPLAGKTLDDLAKEIRAGNIYVNVHSIDNPAGVMRAQLPTDAVPAPSGSGSGPTAAPKPPSTGTGLSDGSLFGGYQLGLALLGIAFGSAALIAVRRRS